MGKYEIKPTGLTRLQGFEVEYLGVVFRDQTGGQILDQVLSFAMANEIVLNDRWEQEVLAGLLAEYPTYFSKVKRKRIGNTLSVSAALAFANAMLSRMRKGTVSPQEAHERAEICLGCDLRKKYVGCSLCRDGLEKMYHPPEVIHDLEGIACSVCQCHLSMSVWMLPSAILSDPRNLEYPDHCWKAKVLRERPLLES